MCDSLLAREKEVNFLLYLVFSNTLFYFLRFQSRSGNLNPVKDQVIHGMTITYDTAQCDRWKLRIWSHILKKSLIENFIFWAV